MPKQKHVKLKCKSCGKKIYRITKDMDIMQKLCQKCNSGNGQKSCQNEKKGVNRHDVTLGKGKVKGKPKSCQNEAILAEKQGSVLDDINHYEERLTIMRKLYVEFPNSSFFELNNMAKNIQENGGQYV